MADKGEVSNTYADGFGVWHAEVEAAEGNGPTEVFGCPWATVRARAIRAIKAEINQRQGQPCAPVRVDYVGMFPRDSGGFVARFRERVDAGR